MKVDDVQHSMIEALKSFSVLRLDHYVHVATRQVKEAGETTGTLPDSCRRKTLTYLKVFPA